MWPCLWRGPSENLKNLPLLVYCGTPWVYHGYIKGLLSELIKMVMRMMQDNDMFGDGSFVSGALGNLVLLTKVNGFPEMGKIMMIRMTMMMKVLIIVIDNNFDIHVVVDVKIIIA